MQLVFLSVLLLLGLTSAKNLGIVDGQPAKDGQFPWQVALLANVPGLGWAHICGGSLISKNRVLTAAQCFDESYGEYMVALGFRNFDDPGSSLQAIPVKKVVIHADYNPDEVASPNDIAVLKLAGHANTHIPEIGIIPLADVGDDFTGQECTISGWGRTGGDEPSSNELMFVNMQQISNDECAWFWGQSNILYEMICMYEPPKSSCYGDSGGPMVCSGKLAGVTSWGQRGCPGSTPSVFTRVSSFKQWISQQ